MGELLRGFLKLPKDLWRERFGRRSKKEKVTITLSELSETPQGGEQGLGKGFQDRVLR